MVKTLKTTNLKLNVTLRDNTEFLNCDVPEEPFGLPGVVAFFIEEALMIVPMDLVKEVFMYNCED